MQGLFENSPKARNEKLAANAEFVALIQPHLNFDNNEPVGPLKELIDLISAESKRVTETSFLETRVVKTNFVIDAESEASNLLNTLDEKAKAILGDNNFSFTSDTSITSKLLSLTVSQTFITFFEKRREQTDREIREIRGGQSRPMTAEEEAALGLTATPAARTAVVNPVVPPAVAPGAPAVPSAPASPASAAPAPTSTTGSTGSDSAAAPAPSTAAPALIPSLDTFLEHTFLSEAQKEQIRNLYGEINTKFKSEGDIKFQLEIIEKVISAARNGATSKTTTSTTGSTGGAPAAAPAPTAGTTTSGPHDVPLISGEASPVLIPIPPGAAPASSASAAPPPSSTAESISGIPAEPIFFAKHATMAPHPDYQKQLVPMQKDINADLKKRNLGYKLKEDKNKPRQFYLEGPIKILIHADGRMIAPEADKKDKDYAKHLADAMEAVCVMNFHVGYNSDQFDWAPGKVAADKKADFDKRIADIHRNFSDENQLDAGEVEISAGPADGTQHSDYKLSNVLKNTTYADAVKKAIGTKGYVLADDKKSMTRTFSDGTKRQVTFEENGTMKAPRILLGDAFTSIEPGSKLLVTGDERNRAVIIARLADELIAMLRFHVTLYIKGGAAALPGDTIDFRVVPAGLLTAQAREYQTNIMPEVEKRFKAELANTTGIFDKKAYYSDDFKKLITFNGQPVIQPNVQPSPPPATPPRP